MPPKQERSLMDAAKFSFLVLVVLYAVLGAELLVAPGIARLGIVPRTQAGLVGIVFSPLLHASLAHLNANAVPLFALLVLLLTNAEYRPVGTLALIWCASGLGTWLIGRGGSVHLGASSIIFGLAAFLIVAGFKAKSWRSVGVAVLVFFLYGGIFYGALPQAEPISWEGHLCGMIAGIWAATRLPA
jgi:membrane associated rhomboid family serine protease